MGNPVLATVTKLNECEIDLLIHRAKRESATNLNDHERANHKKIWRQLETHIDECYRDSDKFCQTMIELGQQLVLARWLAAKNQNDTGER